MSAPTFTRADFHCPEWCTASPQEHQEGADRSDATDDTCHRSDKVHVSTGSGSALTVQMLWTTENADGSAADGEAPLLFMNAWADEVSLDEAEEFANELLRLVAQARGEVRW